MRALALVLALPFSVLVSSCATTAGQPSSDGLRARDFVPLAVGNRWEYKITPAPPGRETEEVKVIERDANGFFVDNRGGRLAPRTDGLFDGDRFLLQEPIEEGHAWIAVPRDAPSVVERFKIIGVGTMTRVPAGTFEGCVEVEAIEELRHPQTGETATRRMTWTYAPRVGIVKAVGTWTPANQPPETKMIMELVSYDVAPPAPPKPAG